MKILSVNQRGLTRRIAALIIAIVVVLAAVSVVVWFTFFAPTGPATIKIGAPISLTGEVASLGIRFKAVCDAMVENINGEGGIYLKEYGRKLPIELIVFDDESNPSRNAELVTKMITDNKIDVLMNVPFPPITIPGSKVAERYGVPTIQGGPIEVFMANGPWEWSWDWFFSLEKVYKAYIAVLNNFRAQTNQKMALWICDDIDGRSSHEIFVPILNEVGYSVVDVGLFPPDAKDFTSYILKWKEEKCEILYANGYAPSFAILWRQCASMGYRPKIVITQRAVLYIDDIQAIGGDLPLGLMIHLNWHHEYPYPWSEWLYENVEKKSTIEIGQDLGYWAAEWLILKDALERAGTLDKAAVNKAIGETDIMGPAGPIKFNLTTRTGSGIQSIGQWQKTPEGKWELVPIWSEAAEVPTKEPIFPLPPL